MATAPDSLGHEALFLVELLTLIPQPLRSVKRVHPFIQDVTGGAVANREKMTVGERYKFLRMEEKTYREAFGLPAVSRSLADLGAQSLPPPP